MRKSAAVKIWDVQIHRKKIICISIKKKELNTLSGLQEWQNTILQKTFFQHKTITSLGLYVIIIIRIQLDVTFKAIKTTSFQSFLPHVAWKRLKNINL